MIKTLLGWLLKNATFSLYTSQQPIGRRLGGHDIPNVLDNYIILHIAISGQIVLLGYFQTA